jgi:2-keto-4-pentenoate hydratase/2-oxohepta-3-ene-1,7-dioic acid hydratase in catechol pathway
MSWTHLCRYQINARPFLGGIQGDLVLPLTGDFFGELRVCGDAVPLSDVRLLPPLRPSKVIGIGSNYKKHIAEMGRPTPTVPKMFLMPGTAVIGHRSSILIPPATQRVDHEAELGVVIGRVTTRVSEKDAMYHVFGYTCVNDVTARDFQKQDQVFTRGKGFDSFCPIGPWVLPSQENFPRRVTCHVNGVLRQDGSTSDLLFSVPALISFVSHVMTLLPGDIIATGTPAGVGPIVPGDEVSVTVEGIGTLSNPVVARSDRDVS